MRREPHSVAYEVSRAISVVTSIVLLTSVASFLLVLTYANTFVRSSHRMIVAAELKPLVNSQIPERLWSVVSGRIAFEECGAIELIRDVDQRLEDLLQEDENQLEITVARRTMDTLETYASAIKENMRQELPIAQSEELLNEVRSVAGLIDDMLSDCIAAEAIQQASKNAEMTRLLIVVGAVELALLGFSIWASVLIRNRMVRSIREPIQRLENTTGRLASGELTARAEPVDVTELTELAESINIMADHLQDLIRQNKLEQQNLKKAELRTLQAQINPHFLYNTLDTILWEAEDENNEEVIQLTKALSDFFRISLSDGRDWITVREEIRHLTGYLQIQKTRYRDVLSYDIQVAEEIMTESIPKLLLQPLVENAIYHGIKEQRGGGKITITGEPQNGRIIFQVRDSGRGMTPERLEEVRKALAEETAISNRYAYPEGSTSGFGLRNVDQRIRLYYGQSEGLAIQSGPEGTCVSFRIPQNRREETA